VQAHALLTLDSSSEPQYLTTHRKGLNKLDLESSGIGNLLSKTAIFSIQSFIYRGDGTPVVPATYDVVTHASGL